MTRTRILLLNDYEFFRKGAAQVINNQPDIKADGQTAAGFEAFALIYDNAQVVVEATSSIALP